MEQLPGAMDVLSDLVMNPACHAEDVKKERSVILEEDQDGRGQPGLPCPRAIRTEFLEGSSAGAAILGTQKTVRNFDPALLFDFYHDRFRAGNMVISAAGSLDHDDFLAMVTDRFGGLERGTSDLLEAVPEASSRLSSATRNRSNRCSSASECLPTPSATRTAMHHCAEHPAGRRDELTALPERKGEAGAGVFHLQADLNPYRDTGCLMVYAGTSRDQRSEGAGQRVERIPQPARAGRGGPRS